MIDEKFAEERRLHPLTMVYRAIASLPGMAFAVFVALMNKDMQEMIFLAIAGFFALISFPLIVLNYYYFTFYIDPDYIFIQKGVFSRTQRKIPIERIQNVEIKQNFLQQILGIAKVSIETAGAAETEGSLEFASLKNAEDIRDAVRLLQRKKPDAEVRENLKESEFEETVDTLDYSEDSTEKVLLKLSPLDVVYHGLTHFRPVAFVIAVFLLQYANFLPDNVLPTTPAEILGELESFPVGKLILFGAGAFFSAIILSWILNILLTLNRYWGFELSNYEGKLHAEYGLLGKVRSSIPLKKLQYASVATNPLTRAFGFASLSLQTAGLGEKRGMPEVAAPIARIGKLRELLHKMKGFDYPEYFVNVSKKTIRRAFFRYTVAVAVVALGAYFVLPWAALIILVAPLLYYAAVLRYRHRGYYFDENFIAVKQGFIFRRVTFIPYEKIQTINLVATVFQRRLGLATVNIDTAGVSSFADASIIDVDEKDAELLLDSLAEIFRIKTDVSLSNR